MFSASSRSSTWPLEQLIAKASPDSRRLALAAARTHGRSRVDPETKMQNSSPPRRKTSPRDSDRVAQASAEPLKQRIACAVAERVVVGLEAVQVEQEQERRFVGGGEEVLVEPSHERASIAEPGQRITQRLGTGLPQQREVFPEREHQSADHGQEAE